MKKLALFSLIVCLCGVYAVPAFAGSCKERTIKSSSVLVIDGELPDSDEYLYVSAGKRNTHVGFACESGGDENNCNHGTLIAVKGVHYRGDAQQLDNGGLWRCHTEGWGPHKNDRWEAFGATALENCNESQLSTYKFFKTINDDVDIYCKNPKGVGSGTNQWCVNEMCRHRPCKNCGGNDPQPNKCKFGGKEYNYGGVIQETSCLNLADASLRTGEVCVKYCVLQQNTQSDTGVWSIKKCPSGMHGVVQPNPNKFSPVVPGYMKCVKNSTPVDPVKQKTCKQKRSTAEGKACCDLSESEAEYKDGKCNCLDKNTEFKIVDGKGQCVAKEVTPVVDGECEYLIKAGIKCANGNYYLEEGWQKVKKSDFEGKSCAEIKQTLDNDVNRLKELFKDLCKPVNDLVIMDDGKVKNAQSVLSAFTASATEEASVWKTSEGKFNTTRLASDITAGVVLGTVGGVVTGNVIKKNQVKKGFEALHCTVGGQKVADWGDEFNVGLRR